MFSPSRAVLVVIDVQGKLAYLMHEKDRLFKQIQALIEAAKILSIPILYTEQAPQKIGETVAEIKTHVYSFSTSHGCAIDFNRTRR